MAAAVRQRGPLLSFTFEGDQPDAVVACSADGTDIEFPVVRGAVDLDLHQFVDTAGPWRVRIRGGARWLDWPADWSAGNIEPWGDGEAAVLLTVEGAAAPAPVIVRASAGSPLLAVTDGRLRTRRTGLTVDVTAFVGPHGPARLSVVLVQRDGDARVSVDPRLIETRQRGPWRENTLRAAVPWSELRTAGTWDVRVEAAYDDPRLGAGRVASRRVTLAKTWRRVPREVHDRASGRVWVFEPRATYKARALSLEVASLSSEAWRELTRRGPRRASQRPLWLIGELPNRARDNGVALFEYVVTHHPEIDARYVITEDSPDRARAEAVGPIVLHGTVEHARAVMAADRIVSTHHPDYLYPLRTAWMRRRVHAVLVFAQHGVLAAKWVADLYGAASATFATDLFLVSSPAERTAVIRDFGYAPQRVAITGLARFDALLAPEPSKRVVLVMPTWRPWLTDGEGFESTEFAQQWRALLADDRVAGAWEGLEVVVATHHNMAQLAIAGLPGAREPRANESIQDLIRGAAMVVTDYSSVGIDAALLHRPVVYFQFDRDRLQGRTGGHAAELPGDIALNLESAVRAIARAAAAGMTVSAERSALADTFFPARDRDSARRVVEAARAAQPTRPGRTRVFAIRSRRRLALLVGQSPLRTPMVRAVYEVARLLPLRTNNAVFESSFGRQYADSPRAIYEELRRTGSDLSCAWVGVNAPGATRITRLTPSYAKALATAGIVVANQSLPHWFRRRGAQTYLQTWHGTPLKRMLHDLDHITGRDAGYVGRATKAASQWGILLSPNPHTTKAMASAFRHSAHVLEVGYPRNDAFFAPDVAERAARVRAALGIADGRALVLHAPTFRDEALDGRGVFVPTEAIDLAQFASRFGSDATLVLRRHVLDRTPARIPEGVRHCVVDGSAVPDVQDLLLAADVLVTDYSSLAFDFLNTRRPCIFFAPDLASYRDRVRGFYLDEHSDLPGPVVETAQALEAVLAEALDTGSISPYDAAEFAARYCPHDDGHAAQRVVAELFRQG